MLYAGFGYPLAFNPFFTRPIGLLAGAYPRVIRPGVVSFPPFGFGAI